MYNSQIQDTTGNWKFTNAIISWTLSLLDLPADFQKSISVVSSICFGEYDSEKKIIVLIVYSPNENDNKETNDMVVVNLKILQAIKRGSEEKTFQSEIRRQINITRVSLIMISFSWRTLEAIWEYPHLSQSIRWAKAVQILMNVFL